jgi:predicted acyltransferase
MQHRYRAIDVFRGITIVFMILVNSIDSSSSYKWLLHSNWDGCTLADIVFPFFLITVGMSAVLKYSHFQASVNLQILKRTLFLFALGLALNAFPHFQNLDHIRIMGVLQRIAVCYCLASFLCLHTTYKLQAILIIIILLAYWRFNLLYPTNALGIYLENCHQNSVGCIDQLLFSSHHLYQTYFDPEGLMSTIPALATTLIGNLIAYRLLSTESKLEIFFSLIAAGSLCCLGGYTWSFIYPINKSLWTGSFVLWTGGLGLILFSICIIVMEYTKSSVWFQAFEKIGQHSLIIFVLHVLGLKLQYVIHVNSETAHQYIMDCLNHITNQQTGTLIYSILCVLFWFLFAQLLPRSKKTRTLKI